MSRADPNTAQLSTYTYPKELHVDELHIRVPVDADVEAIAPAFRDPAIGGEAGLPPWDADMLRTVMREQLPQMIERGLLSPYVIVDTRTGEPLGGLTLHHFDPMRDAVEVGYWLFPAARGRGVATRSVEAAAEHAFANGIVRVEAHVRLATSRPNAWSSARASCVKASSGASSATATTSCHDATLFARLFDD